MLKIFIKKKYFKRVFNKLCKSQFQVEKFDEKRGK